MKYFTPLVRSLVLAIGLLALSGSAKAQLNCGLDPNNVDIIVDDYCNGSNPVVLLNLNGSFSGTATIQYELGFGITAFVANRGATVEFINGFAQFVIDDPVLYFFSVNVIRLRQVSFTGGCQQNFTGNQVESNLFDLNDNTLLSGFQNNSVDPACEGVASGMISFTFSANNAPLVDPCTRFTASIVPFSPGVTVTILPPSSANCGISSGDSRYRVQTTGGLLPGNYTISIEDAASNCVTSYRVPLVGRFSTFLNRTADARCFGDANGSASVGVFGGDPQVNGVLFYNLSGPISRSGVYPTTNNGTQYGLLNLPNLPAGNYTVTSTPSSGGCVLNMVNFTIDEPEEITATLVNPVDTVCADASEYTINFSGLGGGATRYVIAAPGSVCNDFETIPTTDLPAPNEDGSYTLTIPYPNNPACVDRTRLDTVDLILRLIRPANVADNGIRCTEDFPFELRTLPLPERPMVDVITERTIAGELDTITGPFCAGDDIELFIPNYDPAFNYFFTYRTNDFGPGDTLGDFLQDTFPYPGGSTAVGGFLLDREFIQTVEMRAWAVNPITGCESGFRNFSFEVRPVIELDSLSAGMYTDTICSGDAVGRYRFEFVNGNNLFDYEWVFDSTALDLTPTANNGQLAEQGLVTGSRTDDVEMDNLTDQQQTATLRVTPYRVNATNIYSSGDFYRDTCFGVVQEIAITVDPRAVISATVNDSMAVANNTDQLLTPTAQICSGDMVDISTMLAAENGRYRIRRDTGDMTTIRFADSSFLSGQTRDLEPGVLFQEQLINLGNTVDTVTYIINGYTYGPDGMDGGGDDCGGPSVKVEVAVLPQFALASDLSTNVFLDGSSVGTNVLTDTVCNGTTVDLRPFTLLDPNAGLGWSYAQTNDLGEPATSGTGLFNTTPGTGGEYFTAVSSRFQETLFNNTTAGGTYTYVVQLYNFGPDGINNGGMGDDCPGPMQTFTFYVEPTPELNARIQFGEEPEIMLSSGDVVYYEICSGDDFNLDNLSFTGGNAIPGRAMWVEFDASGASNPDFLNVPDGTTFESIEFFDIGAIDVSNTTGAPLIAELILTPYYEDNTANPNIADDCAGEPITITVVLNPEVTGITTPQTTVVCSDEPLLYQITDASNTIVSSQVGGEDFSTTSDFVVPIGAQGIQGVEFTLVGANGGGIPGTRPGGLGQVLEGQLLDLLPGDTVRVVRGTAGGFNGTVGDGGGASSLRVIAGPGRTNPGALRELYVAAGGGGAGAAEAGMDVSTSFAGGGSSAGATGAGPGGEGGQSDPTYTGGAGFNNGGGGGGGWIGGDGGDSQGGRSGDAGQSYWGQFAAAMPAIAVKSNTDANNGSAFISFEILFDDVRFSLVSKTFDMDSLTDVGTPIVDQNVDTILYGQQFINRTDNPQDVTYVFSTSSEAACPGGLVEVVVTVEPTPTLELASGNTDITQVGPNEYEATICSRDELDAILTSSTMPTLGVNNLRARVISVDVPTGVSIQGNQSGRASNPSGNFGGGTNDRPAAAPVPFFETRIVNNNATPADVVYTVVPRILGNGQTCFGDTLTLTVTVQPGFPGIDLAPPTVGLCSNVSLADNGFDITSTQSFNNGFMMDQIRILSVVDDANGDPNFETISSVFNGTPVSVNVGVGGFGSDTFRNRTGSPIFVTYEVEFINGDGCASRPVTYEFQVTAEPVIDAVESVGNIIDTIVCSTAPIGLFVNPAANSAFAGMFGMNTDLLFKVDIPMGVEAEPGNATYPSPSTTGQRGYFQNDAYVNTTNAPLDVVYTVIPSNAGCLGDSVQYTVTVNPEPFADVMLSSSDSTTIFGLDNAAVAVNPAPEFGVCSGDGLHVSLPSDSLSTPAGSGMAMVRLRITDPDDLVDFPNGTITVPLSELADTLSFDELINDDPNGDPQNFLVWYEVYFEYDGTNGANETTGDCDDIGRVEFRVVVNATNEATVVTLPGSASTDILCSGDEFDLRINAVNAVPAVDSYLIRVEADADLVAEGSTESMDFEVLAADFNNTNGSNPFRHRVDDQSFTNTTPGEKTVTYIVTPFSFGCPGEPDTVSVTYRPEIDLALTFDGTNAEDVLCAETGVQTILQVLDVNGNTLSTANGEYRWRYLGGDASGFTVARTAGGSAIFISAGTGVTTFNNTSGVIVVPQAGLMPGTADFEVRYLDNDNGCGEILDTLTLNFSTELSAGTPDPGVGILCDGVNFNLFNALDGEDPDGQFFDADDNPVSPNFTPNVGGNGTDLVDFDFYYVVGGGPSGCAVDRTDFTVTVEPAPNAGTYVGTPGEACQDDVFFNLFDLIPGATTGGTFTQTGGVDFVTVGMDGSFDQSNVTPGVYTFNYAVVSGFGCGSDTETGIAVEVVAREDCSTVVPCDVITLEAGANVISFDVLPSDNSVQSIFADLIASQNLLQIVSVQPGVNNGDPELFVFLSGLDIYAGSITGGIQPGYGYVVTVAQDATVEVCGTPVDEDLRVALQEDLNIVAYVPQAPQSADTYFNTLNQTGQLDFVRTAVGDVVTQRFYNASPFPFPFGTLTQVENGLGYVVNTGAAIGADTWKRNGFRKTAHFDHFYGVIENGKRYIGQTIQFVDADGNLFGTTRVREGGIYYGELAYGDVANTETKEGFYAGEEVFVILDGETYATGMTFNGNWGTRRYDLNPGTPINVDEVIPTSDLETSLSVFPNPTFGPVSAEFTTPANHREVLLAVFNTMGQIVFEQKVNDVAAGQHLITFDVNNLPAGSYQLILSSEVGLIGRKQFIRK
jgi:hypothetical protein